MPKGCNILTASLTLAAIEFASPMMLGWLAAAALPWLINLWSRRRHVETPWAAVDLLMAAVRERSRRLRLRELLLLALRTTILLLAAFAAARPLWRQTAGASSIAERTYHLLVIDQSFSMACETNGATRFERAQQRARQIVNDAPAGDAFTVIAWSDVAENVLGRPTFEATSALAAIDAIECVDTPAELSTALRAVDAAIKATRQSFPGVGRARTVFVSDLQMLSWAPALSKPAVANEGREDASDSAGLWAGLPKTSEIVLESLDDGERQNVAITDVTVDPPTPVLDQPLSTTVRLKAFGVNSSKNVAVELLLDGIQIGRQTATLPPSGESTLRFETRLSDPGNHVFEARIGDDVDAIPVDNRRWLSVEATRGPRVICFADAASAAEDVARALNPRYRDGATAGGIDVEVAATASLASTDLSKYDAVFACNVAEFTAREQRLLAKYAAGGGAVVFVLGDRVRPAVYNEMFSAEPNEGAFMGPLLQLQMAEQPATGEWRFDPLDYRHPVMKPFAGRSRSGLLGVRVTQYYPLQTRDDAAVVALAFTSGDPALVVGEYGLGRIAILATDPALAARGEPWSTLAVSPSFVPLLRELFAYLTTDRRGERLNRVAGEPLLPPWSPASDDPSAVQWKTPGGVVTSSPPDSRRRGVYTAQQQQENSNDATTSATAIAVNVDPAESDLATIDTDDLNRQTMVHAAAPTAAGSIAYAGAVPLAPYVLAAAALLVLAELTAAWLFGRGWA